MIRLRPESLDGKTNHELATVLRSRVSEIGMLPGVATEALEMMAIPSVRYATSLASLNGMSIWRSKCCDWQTARFTASTRPSPALKKRCFDWVLSVQKPDSSVMLLKLDERVRIEKERIRDVLWQHSYLTAVTGVQLNRWLDLGFQGEEFTGCLLHDFGRMLLAVLMPAEFSAIDPLDFDESVDVLSRESDAIGTNHAELAAWYVADNSLPASLIEAVRWHHDPVVQPSSASWWH